MKRICCTPAAKSPPPRRSHLFNLDSFGADCFYRRIAHPLPIPVLRESLCPIAPKTRCPAGSSPRAIEPTYHRRQLARSQTAFPRLKACGPPQIEFAKPCLTGWPPIFIRPVAWICAPVPAPWVLRLSPVAQALRCCWIATRRWLSSCSSTVKPCKLTRYRCTETMH